MNIISHTLGLNGLVVSNLKKIFLYIVTEMFPILNRPLAFCNPDIFFTADFACHTN